MKTEDERMLDLIAKYKKIPIVLIQMKLGVSYQGALRLYRKYIGSPSDKECEYV